MATTELTSPTLTSPPLSSSSSPSRAHKGRRGIVLAALAALALGGGAVAYKSATTPAAPKFETVTVDRGAITSRVTATGTLSALTTVQVGAQVTGRVKEMLVDFNSPVKKGELIARIDAQSFDEAIKESEANVAAARASLEKAQTESNQAALQEQRLASLVDKGLVARADYDAAKAAAASARASVSGARSQVSQAAAALEKANTNRGYTEIYSPIDGVVLSRAVDVGQTVAASLSAPTLFTIAGDLAQMQVEASVSEADVGRVSEGEKATFTVDAYPGEKFAGVVRQVRSAPINVQNVVTYTVVVGVENAERRLKPGMTANVSFIVEEAKDVLRVPNAALRYRPAAPAATASVTTAPAKGARDSGRTLTVLRGDTPATVRVQLGISDGTVTELKSGELREGDRVVSGALDDTATAGASSSSNGNNNNKSGNASLFPAGGGAGGRGGRGGGAR